MADLAVGGLATGIDTASLIQKLMALERRPQEMLQSKVAAAESKISIFNQINIALNSLESVVKEMNTPAAFVSRTSAVSDGSVATATVDSTAQPGTHIIEVGTLAQFQRQISDTSYAGASNLNFNTGTIIIGKVGSPDPPVSIPIGAGQNSLSGIAAAINGSGANVSASLINDGSGYRLIVNGKDTNNYTVNMTGLTTPQVPPNADAYAAPTFTGGIGNLDGRPASFTVDGITMTRTSNSVSDVIPGVTFNLLKDGGSSTTLNVSTDITGVTARINSFVSAYNNAMTLLNKQSNYNSTTKVAGTLVGDSTVREIKKQLQSVVSSAVAGVDGNFSGLSAIGISTVYQDGTLKIDATKLTKAMSTNFDAVADLFTHNSEKLNLASNQYGIAQQLSTQLDRITGTYVGDDSSNNGKIAIRIKGLNDLISSTNKRIADMEDQLTRKQDQMKRQYAAMESLVSSITSSGSQLLALLNNSNTSMKNSAL